MNKKNLKDLTDEELDEALEKIPQPVLSKDLEELKAYASELVARQLDEMKDKSKIEGDMESVIHETILRTKLEEEKMLLVYGHCYTAILEARDGKEEWAYGLEALVSHKDPRKDDNYKDRIIHLHKLTVLNFPPRVEMERLK